MFLRSLTIITMVFETYSEANEIAREAHRKCPFVEW